MASILVAEDDRLGGLLLCEVLRRAGHAFELARDGLEAARLLRQPGAAYDLAIVDLVMPGLDGAQLISVCREVCPAMPVILTSGYAEDFVQERLGALRPDAFLRKPWDTNLLAQTVAGLLARQPATPSRAPSGSAPA